MLTASHFQLAAILDRHCGMILVGDSLGMVAHGYETTLPVSLDLMIAHGAAVVRGTQRALVIVDLPFGAYEESPEVAFRSVSHASPIGNGSRPGTRTLLNSRMRSRTSTPSCR